MTNLNAFFNEKTRDVLKYLPVLLVINNQDDLNTFKIACENNKQAETLPIKLNCRFDLVADEVRTIKKIAKKANINLSVEHNILPYGVDFFGKKQWKEFFGTVDDLRIPPSAIKWLESDFCLRGIDGELIPTGKKWKEVGVLFLLPQTVNGKPFTPNLFRELLQHPKLGGRSLKFDIVHELIFQEYGNRPLNHSVWAFLTRDIIEGTRHNQYNIQKTIVESLPGCRLPDFFSTIVGICTHYINTGITLYSEDPWTYTRCLEIIQTPVGDRHVVVGGFCVEGVDVDYDIEDHASCGMAALVILEDFPIAEI